MRRVAPALGRAAHRAVDLHVELGRNVTNGMARTESRRLRAEGHTDTLKLRGRGGGGGRRVVERKKRLADSVMTINSRFFPFII